MKNFKLKRPGAGPNIETLTKASPASSADNPTYFNLDELELDEDGLDSEAALLGFDENEETLKEVAEQTTYGAVFLNDLIKRQRALSLSVAIVFLVIVFSLPLLSFLLPSLVAFEIFGFDVSWLVLSILIYPVIWLLAFYFVSTADKYEEDFTKLVK
jgi:hypothetical protein